VFLSLLACFGIDVTSNVYPRIDSSVDVQHLKQTLKLMHQTLNEVVRSEEIEK
jgi:hypothetical protein